MSAFGKKLPESARWVLNFLLFLLYWIVGGFIAFQAIGFYEYFTNTLIDPVAMNMVLSIPFFITLVLVVFWPKKVLL